MTDKERLALYAEISDYILNDESEALENFILKSRLTRDEIGEWLILAASEGKIHSLCILLELGASVDIANEDGETAFSFACCNNELKIAKTLHSYGANINTTDRGGGTPLDWAVCHASPTFRTWLRSVGGVRNSRSPEWPWTDREA